MAKVTPGGRLQQNKLLRSMCRARSRGVPLQYIIGDQPFGDLQILCRRNVLIPRAETESFTVHASKLILKRLDEHPEVTNPQPLRILDLCSGTGAIALLLHALLANKIKQMTILGIDISSTAVTLASKNLEHNLHHGFLLDRARTEVHFRQGNVLSNHDSNFPHVDKVLHEFPGFCNQSGLGCDVLISNPPYIAPNSFWDGTTGRSVRIYEPKLALVPSLETDANMEEHIRQEDVFYHDIFQSAMRLGAKLIVFECGSYAQACRVVGICEDIAGACARREELAFHIVSSSGLEPGTHISGSGPCAIIIERSMASEA
ncbi:hypothetical protein FE257_002615 [Aspergillus nanangensis]|uniref:Methyltransferase small domain-containing protein n=1 Tax=Aspergillus nanangensis TaxID=2582783 RepID=A0AAD4CT26_ASPNN|nr:hypothetical protein FE257_002615 [Aspergillus nanangensis]